MTLAPHVRLYTPARGVVLGVGVVLGLSVWALFGSASVGGGIWGAYGAAVRAGYYGALWITRFGVGLGIVSLALIGIGLAYERWSSSGPVRVSLALAPEAALPGVGDEVLQLLHEEERFSGARAGLVDWGLMLHLSAWLWVMIGVFLSRLLQILAPAL